MHSGMCGEGCDTFDILGVEEARVWPGEYTVVEIER